MRGGMRGERGGTRGKGFFKGGVFCEISFLKPNYYALTIKQ